MNIIDSSWQLEKKNWIKKVRASYRAGWKNAPKYTFIIPKEATATSSIKAEIELSQCVALPIIRKSRHFPKRKLNEFSIRSSLTILPMSWHSRLKHNDPNLLFLIIILSALRWFEGANYWSGNTAISFVCPSLELAVLLNRPSVDPFARPISCCLVEDHPSLSVCHSLAVPIGLSACLSRA